MIVSSATGSGQSPAAKLFLVVFAHLLQSVLAIFLNDKMKNTKN